MSQPRSAVRVSNDDPVLTTTVLADASINVPKWRASMKALAPVGMPAAITVTVTSD